MGLPVEQPGFRLIDGQDIVTLVSYLNNIIGNGGTPQYNGAHVNLLITGLLNESFVDNITAHAGGGQAAATQLTAEVNRVTISATPGDSVALPAATAGLTIFVINHGLKPIQVYGNAASGDTINDATTATGVQQIQGSNTVYTCTTAGKWYSNGTAEGYSGSYMTLSSIDSLVAHAGGGQALGTLCSAMLNRFATVATANDSGLLPVSANGMNITVINAGANSMNLFPATGEQINALGANVAFALAAGKTAEIYCVTAGQWHTILSA